MGLEEIKTRIEAGELASTLSRESWERRLKLVKEKHFNKLSELLYYFDRNDIAYRCALCHFMIHCRRCPLDELSENCFIDNSAYNKVNCATNNEQLIDAIENLISVLRKAEEYERSKVKN